MTGPKGGRYYVSETGQKHYGKEAVEMARQEGVKSMGAPPKPDKAMGLLGKIRGDKNRAKAEAAAKESQAMAKAHPGPAIPKEATPEQVKAAKDFVAPHQAHLVDNLHELINTATKDAVVTGRAKEVGSALEKTIRKPDEYPDVTKLQDATGMRVMAKDIDSVKKNVANIKANYKVIAEEDAITKPKGDYRSYHLTVETKTGQVAEIQVRTPGQHEFAEWAHNVYKPTTAAQKTMMKDPAVKAEIAAYSKAISEHIYRKDLGKDPGERPRPSATVKAIFGEVKGGESEEAVSQRMRREMMFST